MKWIRVAAWVGFLALLGQVTRSSESSLPDDANRAKLRAEVIRLRTEIESLQLDYDIERADILDDVKTMKSMEMMSGLMVMGNLINRAATSDPDAPRPAAPTPAEVKATDESAKKIEEEKATYIAEKKKFALLAASLIEKKLDLEDVEARYREAAVKPVVESSESRERIPILDPLPGDHAKPCLDPPSEDEIWKKVPRSNSKVRRDNARFLVEKIGEKVDPCKVYPLAGLCQLVHCHYKCTISFDEIYESGDPIKITQTKARVEVVYIDKDHLRRCGQADAVEGKSDGKVGSSVK